MLYDPNLAGIYLFAAIVEIALLSVFVGILFFFYRHVRWYRPKWLDERNVYESEERNERLTGQLLDLWEEFKERATALEIPKAIQQELRLEVTDLQARSNVARGKLQFLDALNLLREAVREARLAVRNLNGESSAHL
jgi:hypothetical protein